MPNPTTQNNYPNIAVILVRARVPENVGFVSRSMKSMGFHRLILVDPAFQLNLESPAYKTASGSHEILNQAQTFRHFDKAIQPFHHVIGFSRRSHDFERPQVDLVPFVRDAIQHLLTHQTALVFGAEDYGLGTAEKQLCKKIVTIPMKAESLSLNLSHAVTVVLYEINRISAEEAKPPPKQKPPATHEDTQRVVNRLLGMLEPTSYFKEGRKEKQMEEIRHLIQKLNMDQSEYNAVMGMLNALLTKEKE